MPVLKAKVGTEWVPVGGVPDVLWTGPEPPPTAGYELWADTDEPALTALPVNMVAPRFTFVNATTCQLALGVIPLRVGAVWQMRTISPAVTISNAGLTANTSYYAYAFDNASATQLEFSATGHVTDSAFGVEVKSGDPSRTLVGMVRTGAGTPGVFQLDSQLLGVLSWFARRRVSVESVKGTDTAYAGLTPAALISGSVFLTWGLDATEVWWSTRSISNNGVGNGVTTQLGFNTAFAETEQIMYGFTSSQYLGLAGMTSRGGLAEGLYVPQIYGAAITGGTATWGAPTLIGVAVFG